MGAAGSGAPRKGDLGLPGAAEETDVVRWADDLPGLGRNGPPCERSTDVDAEYNGLRELALPYEYMYLATMLMRSVNRHSLWRVYPDTVCASSRDGCLPGARKLLQVARQRQLAEAGGIAAGV